MMLTLADKHPVVDFISNWQTRVCRQRCSRFVLPLIWGVLSTLCGIAAFSQEHVPYYGFYPLADNPHQKELQHNLLGFSIRVPSDWTFGVAGDGPVSVAILYPDGLDTSRFTDKYISIEVGQFPAASLSLPDAYLAVFLSLNGAHAGLRFVEAPHFVDPEQETRLAWTHSWPSRSGVTIVEHILLVSFESTIRTVTIRAS